MESLKYKEDWNYLVPHFDASRLIFIDDNASPYRARIVWEVLQNEADALSPDLNPIEHLWNQIGKIIEPDPSCQNLAELGQALVNH